MTPLLLAGLQREDTMESLSDASASLTSRFLLAVVDAVSVLQAFPWNMTI